MSIIRGERIEALAVLKQNRELDFSEKNGIENSFLEEECQRAFQHGSKAGEKIGYEKALNETKVHLDLLQAIADKLLEQKKRLLDQLKPQIIEFAITLCEKIIRNELKSKEALVKLIHSLLTISLSQSRQESLQIFLAPDDLIMLEGHLAQIQCDKHIIAEITFRADPMIKRGDCRLETQTGLLNYSISRQLSDLQTKILQG
jgi:flagellar assembly protein FliH